MYPSGGPVSKENAFFREKTRFAVLTQEFNQGNSRFVNAATLWPRRSHCSLAFSSGLPMDRGP